MNDAQTDDGNEQRFFPKIPDWAANLVSYFKIAELLGYVLFFFGCVSAALAPWLPGVLSDRYFALLLGVLGVAFFLLARFLGRERPGTREALAALAGKNVLSNQEREGLAEMLQVSDRSGRYAKVTAFALALLLVGVLLAQPALHSLRMGVPDRVVVREARYFQPSQEQDLLRRAPFLGAVRKSLVEEATASERYAIVLFETAEFRHPTYRMKLTLDSEASRFDLTGYAFRRRGDSYEPIPADLSKSGQVTLVVPRSEDSDRVYGIMRLTMKSSEPFPSDLTREIRITAQKAE